MIRSILLFILFLKNKVMLKKVSLNGFSVIHAFPGCRIDIGEGTCINSSFTSNLVGLYQRTIIVARYGGNIKIGENCGISGSTIYAYENIQIGDNTLIGANCKIVDNDFHPVRSEERVLKDSHKYVKTNPIMIGRNCFIGMNSIILKGSVIGDNVVVGAGSVVHGSIPDNCIVAGNPAKIIKFQTQL